MITLRSYVHGMEIENKNLIQEVIFNLQKGCSYVKKIRLNHYLTEDL